MLVGLTTSSRSVSKKLFWEGPAIKMSNERRCRCERSINMFPIIFSRGQHQFSIFRQQFLRLMQKLSSSSK